MRTAAPQLLVILAVSLLAPQVTQAEIAWESELRTAHAKASAEGKLLLLHFYSDNCIWCDRLEAGAFQQPQVGDVINRDFIPLKVHANKSPKLATLFKVTKFPTDVIVTVEGQTLAHKVSPQQSARYVAMLTDCLASKPVAQVAEKPEPPALPPHANQRSGTRQADPVLPARPNDELTMTPGSRLNGNVQARLAGVQASGLNPAVNAPQDSFLQLPTAVPQTTAGSGSPEMVLPGPQSASPSNPSAVPVVNEQPELAMQGFCAVTVINENKWVEGNPEYGVIHLGKLYLFSNQQAMGAFLADPVPYTPVLNEIDVVRFFEERKIVKGKREFGVLDPIHNRMFFFFDEAALKHFEAEYERYTGAAIEVMDAAIKEANPGT